MMNTTTHTPGKGPTPGPWIVTKDSDGSHAEHYIRTPNGDLKLSRAWSNATMPTGEVYANALFIAAAPETAAERDRLREALQHCRRVLNGVEAHVRWTDACITPDRREFAAHIAEAVSMARAALGEQP